MPTGEESMTAAGLLAAYEAGRTQHMESRTIQLGTNPRTGKVVTMVEHYLVLDAEVQDGGTWRHVTLVGTDTNDETQPVFLDLDGASRQVLTMTDSVTVRGLADATTV